MTLSGHTSLVPRLVIWGDDSEGLLSNVVLAKEGP